MTGPPSVAATTAVSRCQGSGLLITTQDRALTLFPPLNIARDVAEEGLHILELCA